MVLYDPRHSRTDSAKNPILASATATQGPSTTLDGNAGAAQTDPRRIPLTATSDITVGSFFLITDDDLNRSERVEIVEVAAADYIRARYPLQFDYDNADTFASALLTSAAVPTAWASDKDNLGVDFEAVWSYTTGGIAYVTTTRWDLVREVPDFAVSDSDLLERHPDMNRWARKAYSPAGFAQIRRAAVRDVETLMRMLGFRDPALLRGNEIVRALTERQCILLIAEDGGHPPGYETQREFREHAQAKVDEIRAGLLEGTLRIPVDKDNDQIVEPDEYDDQLIDLVR